MRTHGEVQLNKGGKFVWMSAKDGEISGFIENNERKVVDGSSGWWRTEDPDIAAQLAADTFGFTVLQTAAENS